MHVLCSSRGSLESQTAWSALGDGTNEEFGSIDEPQENAGVSVTHSFHSDGACLPLSFSPVELNSISELAKQPKHNS